MSDLEEFHHEFFQEVHGSADAAGRYVEDAFFDIFCNHLVDAGDLETAHRAHFVGQRGLRVDGYGGDPNDSDGSLNLIIADFNQSQEVETLNATEMDAIFKRVSNFLSKSLDPDFRNSLEETSPAFGLADLIAKRWSAVSKVRLFLVSNRALSTRVDGRPAEELDGIPVTYSVWDLTRLHRFVASGRGREEIEVDLKDFGGPLAALPAHLNDAGYEAYLVVVPGKQLAAIYDRWGSRLLEQNVRVFLQARGNVNKGIRDTLQDDPEMFFAYNNGITATAEAITSKATSGGFLLTGFKNLQIVNGGQTTASIHAASRKKDADLSRVFVQMKLSIVDNARAEEVVPKISEYANTQNKVSAADFFSNHPFHIRLEEFSRRIFAPSADGTFRETKWFYERARGQYQDARALLTPAQRKKFDLDYPKRQVVSKTDLAKFLMVWRGRPDIVSKGAQKNFAKFAEIVGEEWSKQPDAFNETYFRHAIAKAIVFLQVEKLITGESWYEGGYRANLVAYAISKVWYDIDRVGLSVDFAKIWQSQSIPVSLEEMLTIASKAVHDIIINPPSGMRNISEWAKQQACWNGVASLSIKWPSGWRGQLISKEEEKAGQKDAVKEQKVLNGIEAQIAIVNAGASVWREIKEWGMKKGLLSEKEADILEIAAGVPRKMPTDKQSVVVIETLQKLRKAGCKVGPDIP